MRRADLSARLFTLITMVAALPALAGCASSGRTAAPGTVADAIADYEAHRYDAAHDRAARIADDGPAADRDRAAYVAGLAAWKLGDEGEAEARLTHAARSTDPRTAGSARAQLGILHLRAGQSWRAATAFTTASDTLQDLDALDAARAARWASTAFEQAGDAPAAERWRRRGDELAPSTTAAARAATADARLSRSSRDTRTSASTAGPFALQVGAFRERDRAERAASDADAVARSAGLDGARITERSDERVGVLYVVQIGAFKSRREADRARSRTGRLEYIVAHLE